MFVQLTLLIYIRVFLDYSNFVKIFYKVFVTKKEVLEYFSGTFALLK